MSVPNQANGKKSSNSSIANTPASTPITNSNGNSQNLIHNSPPPNNNAPKYGTLVPNRIFVGGISANTTEGELLQLFSTYGTVKAAKIIQDRAGVSKGYGFITFESEDDAKRPLREADNIVLRERKLNIAPAIKKQPFNFNRAFDGSSPPAVTVGNPPQYFLPPGAMPYFQGGVGYYAAAAPPPTAAPPAPGDPNAQQQAVYQPPPVYTPQTGPPQAATYPSMMFPAQTIYMPQQYPVPIPYEYNYYTNNGPAPAQYVVGPAPLPPGGQGPPSMQQTSGSPPRMPQQHQQQQQQQAPHGSAACYGQQMAYAAAAEPMFYNVPVYGGPLDHGPIYGDDGTGNPYAEDNTYVNPFIAQDMIEVPYPTQDTPPDTISTTSTLGENCQNQQHQKNNNSANSSSSSVASTSGGGGVGNGGRFVGNNEHSDATNAQQQQQRKTNTPVVSLLCIDHSQEKDLNAMQGGRKKKPLPGLTPTLNSNNGNNAGAGYQQQLSNNGFIHNHNTHSGFQNHALNYPPPAHQLHHHHYPPPTNLGYAQPGAQPHLQFANVCPPFVAHAQFNGTTGHHGPVHPPPPKPPYDYHQFNNNNNKYTPKFHNNNNNHHHNHQTMMSNGYTRKTTSGGGRRQYNSNNRYVGAGANQQQQSNSHDYSNRSSVRTDSNSSAASANLETNEEKTLRTTVTTPPPAPYSPLTNHGYSSGNASRFNGAGSRQSKGFVSARASSGGSTTFGSKAQWQRAGVASKINDPSNNNNNNNSLSSNNNNVALTQSKNAAIVLVGQSEVLTKPPLIFDVNNAQVHTGQSQGVVGNLSGRRNRRSIRRNNAGGGEMGAGDAPFTAGQQQQNENVNEACKKFDALKL